jgi:hypothetical protein
MVKSEVEKESFSDYLYNAKEGTVMGRTAGSWAKILGFYCVYYGFLACIFYFGLSYYKSGLPKVGGAPKIVSRLDQPGIGVYPFYTYRDDRDNLEWPLSTSDSDENNHYIKHLAEFLAKYDQESATECVSSAAGQQCKINNFAVAKNLEKTASDWLKNQRPYVFLSANKIYNWKPINSRASEELNIGDDQFRQNSIYFDCYEVEGIEVVKNNTRFDIKPVDGTDEFLASELFPFTGNPNYQKPFVIYEIIPKGEGWRAGENHQFRCDAIADNIQGPKKGDFNEQNDQAKNGIGFAKFGFQYK